jgi:hypothetical protein
MRTIKMKFVNFWLDFDIENDYIYKAVEKNYVVDRTKDADYIMCSVFGECYDYINYPQIRIMYSGENYIPDFNLVDYAVSRYPLELGDRHYYLPGCIDEQGHSEELQYKDRNYGKDILEKKIYFANFIAGHESEYGIRGDFFKKLCEYKRVESPGKYLNNMPEGENVNWKNSSKTDFQRKCKFTLCFESTLHEGFVTEKITDAFYADTIPVYYGSSTVKDIFNEKAFINCSDYESFEKVIEKIIELDNDDEKYLEMLRQPIFIDPMYATKKMEGLEKFFNNIFEQPIEKAYRRSRIYLPQKHEQYLSELKCNKVDAHCLKTVKLVRIVAKRMLIKVKRKFEPRRV